MKKSGEIFAVELDQKRPVVACMFTFGSTEIPNAMALVTAAIRLPSGKHCLSH